ncbi:MAG: branched-chain alpha-keto acid dehydrogenase subunit E2 [Candidatus Marinimicrobia bacterium]|jgi:pyruvate dehydrogenase E2 component (dihydrolipoamide acetyltransferase)|nr:branched-chain alpha-keto acid dehydrogenase subunit E2 [Candidatus Neomarinimicrobiota bacterium]MBT3840296.1 branched-chain alpha-keto acid dehydrogenase subunit E2 [Candidatus Neomarinimicrobiota bacterium]MBT4000294.1 branched-chain alpha-keto acid dehydrogenase subunit E2 [Candidatus Neomarinimicrobiota bacterium]MBT4382616.1 branched-chain alpha-keto acid dehydrogenase subunit E2 [Candidatus Neomarinimicrobiota bacterium]MBT4578501.1 branched-chain alpha-keto acid dehydrogenase subunit
MIKEIVLPDLGEGIDGAEVSEVPVSIGDRVGHDDTILVLESDKASMEIPAETTGSIVEILVTAGDELKTGHLLMKIEVSDENQGDISQSKENIEDVKLEQEKQTHRPVPVPAEAIQKLDQGDNIATGIFASPGVRRLSRELNIDLKIIKGTGQKGRITKDDLNGYIKLQMAMSSGLSLLPKQEIDFSTWGDVESRKLTRIQKITGERLQVAWQSIPHVTQFDEADITDLDVFRKELKLEGIEKGIKITFLPFIMKAVAIVLKEMPEFNSSLDFSNQNLVLKNYYHLGVAVDTPNGLTVPVIKDVNQKTIFELSETLTDLSTRARDKKLKPDEMKGGTFTISSLGGIGGTGFSPIVNPPEVAIMGVSRSKWKPVYDKKLGEFLPRFIMPFSLSYDHRVIDGAAAATFTSRLAKIFSDVSNFKG